MSSRSTPSSVSIFSPGLREPHDDARAREPVEVEGVQRAAPLEHDVVGDVDHVADRARSPASTSRRFIQSGDSPIVTSATIATKRGQRSGRRRSTVAPRERAQLAGRRRRRARRAGGRGARPAPGPRR